MPDTTEPLIVEYLRYNTWANLRLLEVCEKLTNEQLSSSVIGTYGTIYRTWVHIIDSEDYYLGLLTKAHLPPPFRWEDTPSLAEIKNYAVQTGEALVQAAVKAQADDLVQEETKEGTLRYKAIVVWIQIVDHGIEHRTNITTILTQLGLDHPEIDAWGYLSANPDRMGAA